MKPKILVGGFLIVLVGLLATAATRMFAPGPAPSITAKTTPAPKQLNEPVTSVTEGNSQQPTPPVSPQVLEDSTKQQLADARAEIARLRRADSVAADKKKENEDLKAQLTAAIARESELRSSTDVLLSTKDALEKELAEKVAQEKATSERLAAAKRRTFTLRP